MSPPLKIFARTVTALMFSLLLACGSPVNQENFNKVQTGMTEQEVEAILGAPTESSSTSLGNFSGGSATWKTEDAMITVQYLNGQVQFKQYTRGNHE